MKGATSFIGRGGTVPHVLLWLAALSLLAALSAWAWAPLDTPDLTVPTLIGQDGPREESLATALDTTPFRAPLWVAPPAPPPPAPAAPPPPARPPFKLQLVAIVRDDGTHRALLYDPDNDKLLSVTEGQTLAEATVVEKITATGIQVRDGQSLRSLALREDAKGAKP